VSVSTPAAFALTLLAALFLTSFAAYNLGVAADGGTSLWDDAVSLYEAKVHASGRLFGPPAPAEPRSFRIPMVLEGSGGRLYGKDYPGFPLLLAIGVRFGREWLVSPVLGGLVVVATFLLGRSLRGPATGLAAALLVASSPSLLDLSSRYLNHVACQLLVVVAALLLVHSRRSRRPARWTAAAGFVFGWALGTRPYSAALLGIPLALALLAVRGRNGDAPGARRKAAIAFAAGAVPWILGLLAWNVAMTGDPLTTPYQLWKPENQPTAFQSGPEAYTPRVALDTARVRIGGLARQGLAVPWALAVGLILPLAAFRRLGRTEFVLALAGVVLIAGHFFYPGSGNFSARIGGARFYSEALPAYAILVATGAAALLRRAPVAIRAAAWLLPLGLVAFAGLRAFPARIERTFTRHDDPLREGNRLLVKHLKSLDDRRRLVFADASTYHWLSAVCANRADFSGPWVVAIYFSPERNRRVIEAFPDHEPYLFRLEGEERRLSLEPYDPATDRTGPPRRYPYTRWEAKERARRGAPGRGEVRVP
jgi:hypothetical protein